MANPLDSVLTNKRIDTEAGGPLIEGQSARNIVASESEKKKMENDSPHSTDPTKIEMAASAACTRSGAFALLLAVVLFLLTMYWLDEKRDEAAGEYVAERTNLAMYLDTLDGDKIWQEYKRSHPDAESMPMSQLLHASVEITQQNVVASVKAPQPAAAPRKLGAASPPRINASAGAPEAPGGLVAHLHVGLPVPPGGLTTKSHGGAPEPPSGLTAKSVLLIEMYEMTGIQEFLGKLNDSELLTRSREASNFFEFSIVSWVQKRSSMMYGNAVTGICQTSGIEAPRKSHRTDHYTPQMDAKALLDCLTLRDVRDLAKFELPTLVNPAPMGRRVAQDVELSPGSLPRNPYMATAVAQALLFFVLTYFTAFTREAASSETFPAPGTLFGAFSRSGWTVGVFFLTLWTPLVACCTVFVASGKPSLAIAVIPIALVTLSAQRTLERMPFFRQLKPVALFRRQKTGTFPTGGPPPPPTQSSKVVP